jgi:glycosyltransferase involved in cell wall biosynthesis
MKVLHILNELKFSGAEIMLNLAAEEFQRKSIQCAVLSTGEFVGEYAKVLENSGYQIFHQPYSKSLTFFIRLFQFLKKEDWDCIHIHAERSFFWYSLVAFFSGIKTIRTIHSNFEFKGELLYRKVIQKWICRNILNVIFVSIGESVMKNELERYKNPSSLIYNWTDDNKFMVVSSDEKLQLRKKFGLTSTVFVISTIGSCMEVKDHKEIFNALKLLKERGCIFHYIQAGDGPLFNEELELAKKFNLIEWCTFIKSTTTPEEIYSVSDIFVMTSKREGLSIASIEAMSCGLPCILYDVPGLRDMIDNDKNGSLIIPNNKVLATEIIQYMKDPDMRQKKSLHSRKFAQERFSMKNSVEAYIQLYSKK